MPVFEYACIECGTRYEVFHKGREVVADIFCPACSSVKYKKLFSVPSVSVSNSSSDRCGDGSCDSADGGCCGGMCGMD